jgi:hypothetical protein
MTTREDIAAAKMQALHRGHQARVVVTEKRNKETSAATKIQSLQRGRKSRHAVEQRRKDLELFVQPLIFQCQKHIEAAVSLSALRQRTKNWEAFQEAVTSAGLVPPTIGLDTAGITYSTASNPASYGNAFNERALTNLLSYDKSCALATQLRAEHEQIMAERPPPVVAEVKAAAGDDEGEEEEDEAPQKSKKQLKEEEDQRKADKFRLTAVFAAEHAVVCLKQKLANVLQLHAVKIPTTA